MAVSPAGRSLVLLGDPQQLDQPLKGSHPPGAERSALAHLLAGAPGEPPHATMPPERGLFIEQTWRLHPAICAYTSELFYASQLYPIEGLERQAIARRPAPLDGSGVRWLPVAHAGNDTRSIEEAGAIVEVVRDLLERRRPLDDRHGVEAPLRLEDIVIVAPYNAHVDQVAAALASAGFAGARVGTVDKFQGQEAPLSIYAMGSSSPEDAPRGMEFLYSLNRLNVATSRARCVALVVASPALVRVRARRRARCSWPTRSAGWSRWRRRCRAPRREIRVGAATRDVLPCATWPDRTRRRLPRRRPHTRPGTSTACAETRRRHAWAFASCVRTCPSTCAGSRRARRSR